MKIKRIVVSLAAVFFTLVLTSAVRAEFVLEQTQNALNAFNSLNDGRGYYYSVSSGKGQWNMTTMSGYDQADFGAYSPLTGGDHFAKTFCVEPLVGTGARHYGTLNYENNSTTTTSGHKLTLGAAYLYTNYATGMLNGYDYSSGQSWQGENLTSAIQYLMGAIFDGSWTSNDFLSALLDVNSDKSHWEQVYDPGQFYEDLGDYSVFVMNNPR